MSDLLRYDGRVAVVTGAGNGLGRAHAMLLASRGAKVVVNDLGGAVDGSGSSATAAERVVAEIVAAGGEAVPDCNTVATVEGGRAIIKTALDAFGRVDIVINNAGILRDKSFKNMSPEFLDPVLDVHLKGAFWVTQAAWELMREQKYGRIVNTSSAAGIFGNFGQTNYGAAKMGIVGFTNVLKQEGQKYNIKANVIAPGAKTRMTEELMGPMASQFRMEPELVSPIVAYLCHESCKVNGEIYSAAAGRVGRIFIGATKGVFNPDNMTIEYIRDHIDEIRNTEGYIIPGSAMEEMGLLMKVKK
ncbi:MAG TPA: SDR family oxidoreductase [Candidatus Acidoferrales bacterium]|nr:SDR family oxidoreductase [Candidatus Acidoferrales bacterium]